MAASAGGSIAVSSFPSSSSSSFSHKSRPRSNLPQAIKLVNPRQRNIACLAVQESPISAVAAETKEKREEKPAEGTAPSKPKPKPKAAAKAPAKALPELMEEDVIPTLKTTLQAQDDISKLQLSFNDNKLEGSFLKKGNPYSFWAFFPDGNLTGPKGFSLSSYGTEVSTVEPFLVDEKKPTAKHVVFWVEKRLAAQGIIPVWND